MTPATGTILRMYDPSRQLLWELLGLEFTDSADADPKSDGTQIYSPEGHYLLTTKGWTWESFTLDPFTSPDDFRHRIKGTQCAALIRYFDGRKFLICRGMWEYALAFYRFDGEIARPSTIIATGTIKNKDWRAPEQPAKGRWIWRDLNGDARMQAQEYSNADGKNDGAEFWACSVDERGDVWQGTTKGLIRHFRFGGLDARGNPIYSRSPKLYDERQIPPPINFLLRAEYIPTTDTMYLSGHTPEHPKSPKSSFGMVGADLLRYDKWSSASPRLRWRIELPDADIVFKGAAAMCVEADRIFVVMCQSAEVRVYDTATGSYLASMKPGPEVHGQSGWIDIRDGIRARKLSNGDFLVLGRGRRERKIADLPPEEPEVGDFVPASPDGRDRPSEDARVSTRIGHLTRMCSLIRSKVAPLMPRTFITSSGFSKGRPSMIAWPFTGPIPGIF